MKRAVDWVLNHVWAILPETLQTIIDVASGENSDSVEKFLHGRESDTVLGAPASRVEMRDGVAVISITGPIFPRANLFTNVSGGTSIQMVAKDFTTALQNPAVKAIVLNIDSPGGEVTGVSEFSKLVFDSRKVKPIVSYIYGMGASAAYWIGSSASEVVVSETALVGSIGVVSSRTDTREKDQKAGIKTIEIVSSASPDKRPDPTTDAGRAQVQKMVDDMASVFVADVARNRGVSPEKVLSDFGKGGILVGDKAVNSGLADSIGSLDKVISKYSKSKTFTGGLMNLEQLKAQHPELYNAILEQGKIEGNAQGRAAGIEEGRRLECERIQGINSLANAPGSKDIIAAALLDPQATKASVSEKILADITAKHDAAAKLEADERRKLAAQIAGTASGTPSAGAPVSAAAEVDAAIANLKKK